MKTRYILLLILYLNTLMLVGQTYKLLPDSTHYLHYGISNGTSIWSQPWSFNYSYYKIDPSNSTFINGFKYIEVSHHSDSGTEPLSTPIGYITESISQQGNQLYVRVNGDTIDYLAMDFDSEIGDTIRDLYSGANGGYYGLYNAVVSLKDSFILSNGSYHHFINVIGFQFKNLNTSSIYQNYSPWTVKWSEQCFAGLYHDSSRTATGIFNSYPPNITISGGIFAPRFCTADTLFNITNPFNDIPARMDCNQYGMWYTNLSIREVLKKNNFILFPNPTKKAFRLKLDNALFNNSNISYSITNLQGQLLTSSKIISIESKISVATFPKGVYLIQLKGDDNILGIQRLIID